MGLGENEGRKKSWEERKEENLSVDSWAEGGGG